MLRPKVSSVLLAPLLVSALSGQVSPPAVRVAGAADGKGYDVAVANTGRSAITALYMLATQRTASGKERSSLVAKDYAFTPNEQPIAPGETRIVRAALEPELKAVLFSDGTAAGDPEWVAAAKKGRELELRAIEKVIQLVDEVRAGQRTLEDAVQELNRSAGAMREGPRPTGQAEAALRAVGSLSAEVVYRGAATDMAGDRRGAPAMSREDRLQAVRRGFFSTRQRALGMAPELKDLAKSQIE